MIHGGRGVIFLTPVAIRELLALTFPRTLGEAELFAQQIWDYINTRWSCHAFACLLIILLSVCVCGDLISCHQANLLFTRIFLSRQKSQRADREVICVWFRLANKFWLNCCNSSAEAVKKNKTSNTGGKFTFWFLSRGLIACKRKAKVFAWTCLLRTHLVNPWKALKTKVNSGCTSFMMVD